MQVLISAALSAAAFATKSDVGEKRPRHGNHVGIATREQRLGDLRIVDPIGRDERNADLALHPPRDPRKPRRAAPSSQSSGCVPRASLTPVLISVAPAVSTAFRQRDDLVPRAAALDQVEQ